MSTAIKRDYFYRSSVFVSIEYKLYKYLEERSWSIIIEDIFWGVINIKSSKISFIIIMIHKEKDEKEIHTHAKITNTTVENKVG
jgi:hypothetical protein